MLTSFVCGSNKETTFVSGRCIAQRPDFVIVATEVHHKEKHMTNQRVAGLVWKFSDGVPLILTHQPAKSPGIEDYSVTTVTGTLNENENGFSAMAKAMRDCFGIDRGLIITEQAMSKTMESLDKEYRWYFMQVDSSTRIDPCPNEIQDYRWSPPPELPQVIENMRAGRRFMFEQALSEACERNLLSRKLFPFLQEPIETKLMSSTPAQT